MYDELELERMFFRYHLLHQWPPSGISPFLVAAVQLVGITFYFTSGHAVTIRTVLLCPFI